MKKALFLFAFLFSSSCVFAQELLEIAHMLSLAGTTPLETQISPLVEKECDGQDELPALPVLPTQLPPIEAQVQFTFELNAFSGINIEAQESKRAINHKQEGFEQKWIQLITPDAASERSRAISQICSDMDQETAMAFAGYMAMKNSAIYDHQRLSPGDERASENIELNDYYAVHRNNEGIGDPAGRIKMGVCAESTQMITDFLSQCGFSCDDLDIIGYNTTDTRHAVISARGENGDFYTANWKDVNAAGNHDPLQRNIYNNSSSTFNNTSAVVSLFDCNGRPRGKSVTPLGRILMLAHEDPSALSIGQDYQEIAMVIEELGGVDEAKLKVFRAKTPDGTQNVLGAGARLSHQFGEDSGLITLETAGSLVIAKATTNFSTAHEAELDQLIVSPYINTRLNFIPLRGEHFRAGIFAQADAASFSMKNTRKEILESETKLEEQSASTRHGQIRSSVGVQAQVQTDNFRATAEAGTGQSIVRNRIQNGSETRPMIINDQLFGNATVEMVHSKDHFTRVHLNYRNLYLMQESVLDANVEKRIKDTGIGAGVTVIKNPDAGTINALGLNLSQGFEIRNNYVELNGGVQYLIIKNLPNKGVFNISAKYRF